MHAGSYWCLLKDVVSRFSVAYFPVEDVVVLLLAVFTENRRVGIHSLFWIDQYWKFFVLNLNEFCGIGSSVAVFGHNERDLLRLEQNFAGGQHHLLVIGQSGHPGKIGLGEILTSDDGEYSRKLLRIFCVDALNASVRIGAAHHLPVDHTGQMDVIHIVALALDEPQVFLALHGVAHAAHFGRSLKDHFATSAISGFVSASAILFAAN